MRVTLIQFILSVTLISLSFAEDAYSQKFLTKRMDFKVQNQSLKSTIRELEKISDSRFIYSNSLINTENRISLDLYNVLFTDVLQKIFDPLDISYTISGNQIVLQKKKGNVKSLKVKYGDNILLQREDIKITGTVKDEKGEPLAGASVMLKGTTKGLITDVNGHFEIAVSGLESVLQFSLLGYRNYEVKVGNRTHWDIVLEQDNKVLKEVVVIGYGTQSKSHVTGSISQLKSTDLADQSALNYDQAMIGKVAGVQISQTTGQPGRGMDFRVRGTGTITSGSTPLIVLDGVPLDRQSQALEMVNTNDIESIEILKDASSAAIYGSRGANGVIMITTKSGKAQNIRVSYSNITGVQQVARKIEMLDAYQFATVVKEGHDNAWADFAPGNSAATPDSDRGTVENGLYWNQTPADLYPYLRGEPGLTNTDWQDAIFRNALLTNQTIAFSGGTNGIRYYVSGNYANQNGIVINSDYKRYSSRINLDATHRRLSMGVNFTPSYSIENRVDADDASGVVANALQISPVFPVYNQDGSYNYDGYGKWRVGRDYQHNAVLNPVAQANLRKDRIYNTNLLARAYVGYDILDGLKYKISLGGTVNNYSNDDYTPTTLPSRWQDYPNLSNTNGSRGYASNTAIYNWIIEHNLTYDKDFGRHHVNILGGFSAQKNTLRASNVTAVNYSNDLNQTVNAGQISNKGANVQEWSLLSWLGRVQYDYEGRYLASVSFRADGSSRFGANNKYGYFPAGSVGWVVSRENFMQAVQVISNLKLRASYGSTGNFQIGNYDHISRVTERNYVLGSGNGTLRNGLVPNTVANPDLGWEVSHMLDIGLELGLFKQRLSFEVDYYDRKTSHLLLNVPIPLTTGFASARQNVGKVGNKGFDILIHTKNRFSGLQWDASLNFSANRNKVLALGPENAPIIETAGVNHNYFITQVGSPIGSYYLMKTDGVYLNQQDLDNSPRFANARPGDFKFVDVDGDGVLDLDRDRTIVGNYFPDFTAGFVNSFSYKGIDLSFTLQAVQGVQIVNLLRRYIANLEGNTNSMVIALDRWRTEGDPGSGLVNRANRKAKGNNGRTSDWHVEDGSFIRMQNISLGYSLPKSMTDRMRIGSARVFLTAQNLFTWTDYTGYNPEVSLYSNSLTPGVDYGTYPVARAFSAGINLNF